MAHKHIHAQTERPPSDAADSTSCRTLSTIARGAHHPQRDAHAGALSHARTRTRRAYTPHITTGSRWRQFRAVLCGASGSAGRAAAAAGRAGAVGSDVDADGWVGGAAASPRRRGGLAPASPGGPTAPRHSPLG